MVTYLDPLRGAAGRQLVSNTMLLRAVAQDRLPRRVVSTKPATLAAKPRGWAREDLEPIGEAAIDSTEGFLKHAERAIPKDVAKAAPGVMRAARGAGGAPGAILDGVEVLTAKPGEERNRAVAGVVGGAIGGGVGGLAVGFEPVTIPAGALAGKTAGEHLHDKRGAIAEAWLRGVEAQSANPAHRSLYGPTF